MTDFAPADWLSLLQGAAAPSPAIADGGVLARHLGSYRCLLESWLQALESGAADPPGQALAVLSRHVQSECLRQLRTALSPGPGWDVLTSLPLPPTDLSIDAVLLSGWAAAGFKLWQAVLAYRRHVDEFCALYDGLGVQTLSRLQAELAGSTDPEIDTVAGLHAHWQSSQDACEASIVRSGSYAWRLAQVTGAAAAVRDAHRQWLAQWVGVETDAVALRALGEEVAAIRRQLRELDRPRGRRR